jgi:hypothetical protein
MTTSTAASLASTPLDRLLGDLETSRAGLTEADAVARLKRCGPNDALAHEGTRSRCSSLCASSIRSF